MKRYVITLIFLVAAVQFALACGGDGDDEVAPTGNQQSPGATLDPSDFVARVDHPLFPLVPGQTLVYEGEETDPEGGDIVDTRVEFTVLDETEEIAGIDATVVEVKDFEDDELVELTRDYYAQGVDGTVYYLGENVRNYEEGQESGSEGQWIAGEGDNQVGIFLPAQPKVGDEFQQERAPGIAEDTSKVVAIDQTVTVPAGTFDGCIKTEDFDPLDESTEVKFYCPEVGLVREELEDNGFLDLVSN